MATFDGDIDVSPAVAPAPTFIQGVGIWNSVIIAVPVTHTSI